MIHIVVIQNGIKNCIDSANVYCNVIQNNNMITTDDSNNDNQSSLSNNAKSKSTCFSHSSIESGCDNKKCQNYVCQFNSFCCTSSWSFDCVLLAINYCCLEDFDHVTFPNIVKNVDDAITVSLPPTTAIPTIQHTIVSTTTNTPTTTSTSTINPTSITSIHEKEEQQRRIDPLLSSPSTLSSCKETAISKTSNILKNCILDHTNFVDNNSLKNGCNVSKCQEKVCKQDKFCCSSLWDQNCADLSKLICIVDELDEQDQENNINNNLQNINNECYKYSNTISGCKNNKKCESTVCTIHPYCCSISWGYDCVLAALELCCLE